MRRSFFLWHALLLLATLIPAKLLKAQRLAGDLGPGAWLLLIVPDLLFVGFAELGVMALSTVLGRRRRWLALPWAILLVPMGMFAATEHRFFLSSGSLLNWTIFWHGISHASQVAGVVGAEITTFWWSLLVLPWVVGLLMAWRAWHVEEVPTFAGPRGIIVGLVATLALVLGAWWGGPAAADPRIASIRPSLFLAMAAGAAEDIRSNFRPEVSEVATNYSLPEVMALTAGPDARAHNLVIILLESVRAGALTSYNPSLDTAPFLDSLAQGGLLAKSAYTTLPHTTKSLVPTLCGVPPDIRQALSETVPGALPVKCLPEMLKPLGYSSAFFQPATGQFEQRSQLIANMGFDKFVGLEQLDKAGFQSPNYLGVEERAMTEPIMEWVDAQRGPFFLGMITLTTHHDYKVPTTFKKKDYGVSERWSDYLNAMRYTDQWLQELFGEFEKRGLMDNTLFVILGDHGEGHGEHDRKGHDEILYQEGVNIPLILYDRSKITRGQVVEGLRQNIDVAPTVVELLGLKVASGQFFGQSLMAPALDRVLHVSCWYENRCLGRLQGDKKFIYYYGLNPNQYFDLAQDPGERHNLASSLDPAQADGWVKEMEAWKKDLQSLYATHKRMSGGGYVLFERPDPDQTLDAAFGDKLEVIGYELPGEVSAGSKTTLSVYFAVKKNMGWHWKIKLDLEDQQGGEHRLSVKSTEEDHPLYTWVPGQFMKVDLEFKVPRAAAEGQGDLRLFIGQGQDKRMGTKGEDADSGDDVILIPINID